MEQPCSVFINGCPASCQLLTLESVFQGRESFYYYFYLNQYHAAKGDHLIQKFSTMLGIQLFSIFHKFLRELVVIRETSLLYDPTSVIAFLLYYT